MAAGSTLAFSTISVVSDACLAKEYRSSGSYSRSGNVAAGYSKPDRFSNDIGPKLMATTVALAKNFNVMATARLLLGILSFAFTGSFGMFNSYLLVQNKNGETSCSLFKNTSTEMPVCIDN